MLFAFTMATGKKPEQTKPTRHGQLSRLSLCRVTFPANGPASDNSMGSIIMPIRPTTTGHLKAEFNVQRKSRIGRALLTNGNLAWIDYGNTGGVFFKLCDFRRSRAGPMTELGITTKPRSNLDWLTTLHFLRHRASPAHKC